MLNKQNINNSLYYENKLNSEFRIRFSNFIKDTIYIFKLIKKLNIIWI
jgi:hypothetical protein